MREDYDPAADGVRSYYAALEAKRARGDTHYVKPPVDYEIDAEPPIEVPGPMSWECKCFLIAVGIVIAMLVLWAGRADAQTQSRCAPWADLKRVLAEEWHEVPVSGGQVNAQSVIQVTASPDGKTFTILAVGTNGTACIIIGGKGWDNYQPKNEGDAL